MDYFSFSASQLVLPRGHRHGARDGLMILFEVG
jgi:hypothetical protein